MKTTTLPVLCGLCLAALFACAQPAAAQAQKSGISRSMEQAIRLYHEGENTEAMDRFMDILVKGSPSEKALANEYINKITLRMNTGVRNMKDAETEIGGHNTVPEAGRPGSGKVLKGAYLQDAAVQPGEDGSFSDEDRRRAIAERVGAKMTQMRRDILLQLSQSDPVKVYMGEEMPKAITLDPAYFFAGETSFRQGTDRLLGLVSGLIFTLGKVNCTILPAGAAGGDVKIKSIRQALAFNSYFEQRGISKSKLDVNLTGSEVVFPKELNNLSGIIILFSYDKEQKLKDLEDMQTKGPKVSLGLYPTAIAVHENEGAIVEFSVFESPAGAPSWTFQIFQVQKDGARLPIQEISGSGAQYNQSYWNGRNKFFGAPYQSGKYIFTVTAKDIEGRETTLSRLLVIRPTPEEEKAAARAGPRKPEEGRADPEYTASGVKASTVKPGAAGAGGKLLRGAAAKKARAKAGVKSPAKPKRAPAKAKAPAAPAAEEPQPGQETPPAEAPEESPESSGKVSYKIYFKENTSVITNTSEKRLAQVADTMKMYEMSRVTLTGYAYSGEADAERMAETRVNHVAKRLTDKYKIDRSRMELTNKVSGTPKSMVEIQMSGGE